MFSSTTLRLAISLRAPFLQCQYAFHAVSIHEMLAIMPLETDSNVDLNLEYSMRDMKELKKSYKYDVAFWYCKDDIPDPTNPNHKKLCDPKKLIEVIKLKSYKIWTQTNTDDRMDRILSVLKDSKLVILGVSDNFAKDEKCLQVFEFTKEILKINYQLVEFGSSHKWKENILFSSVCTECVVQMQDINRFDNKCEEVFEALERELNEIKEIVRPGNRPEVFLSYCWKNSKDAVDKGTKASKTSIGKTFEKKIEMNP
jgi:hypothetical protein